MFQTQSSIATSFTYSNSVLGRQYLEGFDPQIFLTQVNSDFLCPICNLVVRRPRECVICGNIFCDGCIRNWADKLNKITHIHLSPNARTNTSVAQENIIITECPMKCKSNANIRESIMKPIGKVVKNLLYQLQIVCPNDQCGKIFSLDKYEEHEFYCFLPKCQNVLCGQGSDKQIIVRLFIISNISLSLMGQTKKRSFAKSSASIVTFFKIRLRKLRTGRN